MNKPQFKTSSRAREGIDFDSEAEAKSSIDLGEDYDRNEGQETYLGAKGTTTEPLNLRGAETKEFIENFSDFEQHTSRLRKEQLSLSPSQIKEINRAVTRKLPQSQIEAFINERASLINRKIQGDLSRDEERRLAFVRWQLDRIDDVVYGENLDVLEKVTSVHEGFATEIRDLLSQITSEAPKKKLAKR